MARFIENFTGGQEVKVDADMHPSCGPLVMIMQWGGSMSFQFSMKPEQARQLGAALYELADSLDAEPLTKEAA